MRTALLLTGFVFFSACGGSALTPVEPTPEPQRAPQGGLAVEGLLGTVDEQEVQEVFESHKKQLLDCYSATLEDLEEISGDLEIAVRLDVSGRASSVYLSRSSLGSSTVEDCVVRRVSSFAFPSPKGGPVELSFPLELSSGMREPMTIADSTLEAVRAQHEPEIAACGPAESEVVVTLYLDASGRVLSAGGSGASANRYETAQCLARAIEKWTFPAPGASIAKGALRF